MFFWPHNIEMSSALVGVGIFVGIPLLIIGIFFLMWWLTERPSFEQKIMGKGAADGENGGVVPVGHPQTVTTTTPTVQPYSSVVSHTQVQAPPPNVTAPPPVVVYTPPPVPAATPTYLVGLPDITLITIEKDLVSGGTRAFHIGEVIVHTADGRKLTAADFGYVEYNSAAAGMKTSYPASNAVDGNTATFTHTSGENVQLHQLKMKLKVPTKLKQVMIINRADCCGDRLEGAVIKYFALDGSMVASHRLSGVARQTVLQTGP
jgi:hypothetical protein